MKPKRTLFLAGLLVVPGLLSAEPADTVAVNGKVYTMNEEAPWAEAVAVQGDEIVYVGDLKGRMVLPGFIDTHAHLLPNCVFTSGCVIPFDPDKDKMLASLKEYVDANPDGPYYSFGGAFSGTVEITKEEIDAIIDDKPFVMIAQCGHGGWANSKALEACGIETGKPDPVDFWNRDAKGEPTGGVGSSPAIWQMVRILDLISKEGILRSADKVLPYAPRHGITLTFEAATFRGTAARVFEAVSELENSGRLPVRVIAGAMIQRYYDIEGALAELKELGPVYSSDMFDVNFLKIHGDGSPDNRTAMMKLPYVDDEKNAGFVALTPELMKETLLAATGMGYNIHTHTCGDGAVSWALDGFAEVRAAGHDEVRLNTGHTLFMDPADYGRFKELNVGVDSMIPQVPFSMTMPVLTEEQKKRTNPVKSLLAEGVRVNFSSDNPVMNGNPFRNLYIAVTRTDPDDPENVDKLTAGEKIDLKTALKCYTVNGAYMVGKEDALGSIEVGKKADLIVLDRNILEVPIEDVPDTKVLATMLGGKVVHESAVDWDFPNDEGLNSEGGVLLE